MVGVGDLEVKLMGLKLMVEVVLRVMVVGFGADAQLVMSIKVGWGEGDGWG